MVITPCMAVRDVAIEVFEHYPDARQRRLALLDSSLIRVEEAEFATRSQGL